MSSHAFNQRLDRFSENFEPIRRPRRCWKETSLDRLASDQRYSTWPFVAKGCRGPQPRPAWVVEEAAALDTELGRLKTGKEAEVFLIRRATAEHGTLMAAKRYRGREHLQFSRSQAYSEGRAARRSRDNRAIGNSSGYGRQVAALQWASAEFSYLSRCHAAGIPVPYPVQLDGTELLMEFISDPHDPLVPAPRLQQLPRNDKRLPELWEQVADAMERFAAAGLAHGDLSAYNLLVAEDRLVVIDVPQCVDLAGNVQGLDFLYRDCTNVCDWFSAKGLERDADELFGVLLGSLFAG